MKKFVLWFCWDSSSFVHLCGKALRTDFGSTFPAPGISLPCGKLSEKRERAFLTNREPGRNFSSTYPVFFSIFNKCEIQFHGRDNNNQLSYDMFSLGMGLHSCASREEAPLYECIGTLDPDTWGETSTSSKNPRLWRRSKNPQIENQNIFGHSSSLHWLLLVSVCFARLKKLARLLRSWSDPCRISG